MLMKIFSGMMAASPALATTSVAKTAGAPSAGVDGATLVGRGALDGLGASNGASGLGVDRGLAGLGAEGEDLVSKLRGELGGGARGDGGLGSSSFGGDSLGSLGSWGLLGQVAPVDENGGAPGGASGGCGQGLDDLANAGGQVVCLDFGEGMSNFCGVVAQRAADFLCDTASDLTSGTSSEDEAPTCTTDAGPDASYGCADEDRAARP